MDFNNILLGAWNCFKKDLKFFLVLGIAYAVLFPQVLLVSVGSVRIYGVVSFLLSSYIMMSLIRASIASVRGETLGFSLFKNNWKKFLIYCVTALLFVIIIMIGTVLLIVPGVIFMTMFIFAIYLVIDKNIGIIDSFKKSAEITKGSRWYILLLFIIISVVYSLGSTIILIAIILVKPSPQIQFIVLISFRIIFSIVIPPYVALVMAKAYESLNKPEAAI
jgi:uncharacterized membrane protein